MSVRFQPIVAGVASSAELRTSTGCEQLISARSRATVSIKAGSARGSLRDRSRRIAHRPDASRTMPRTMLPSIARASQFLQLHECAALDGRRFPPLPRQSLEERKGHRRSSPTREVASALPSATGDDFAVTAPGRWLAVRWPCARIVSRTGIHNRRTQSLERVARHPPGPGTEREDRDQRHHDQARARRQRTGRRAPSSQGQVDHDSQQGEAGRVDQAFPEACHQHVHDFFPPFPSRPSSRARSLAESALCSISRTSKSSREPRNTRSITSPSNFLDTSSYDCAGRYENGRSSLV